MVSVVVVQCLLDSLKIVRNAMRRESKGAI